MSSEEESKVLILIQGILWKYQNFRIVKLFFFQPPLSHPVSVTEVVSDLGMERLEDQWESRPIILPRNNDHIHSMTIGISTLRWMVRINAYLLVFPKTLTMTKYINRSNVNSSSSDSHLLPSSIPSSSTLPPRAPQRGSSVSSSMRLRPPPPPYGTSSTTPNRGRPPPPSYGMRTSVSYLGKITYLFRGTCSLFSIFFVMSAFWMKFCGNGLWGIVHSYLSFADTSWLLFNPFSTRFPTTVLIHSKIGRSITFPRWKKCSERRRKERFHQVSRLSDNDEHWGKIKDQRSIFAEIQQKEWIRRCPSMKMSMEILPYPPNRMRVLYGTNTVASSAVSHF